MKTCLVLAALILSTLTAQAVEPEEKDPIDLTMDQEMEQDPSTGGMVQAAARADEKWLAEIKKALAKLETEMRPEEWKALRAAQKAWQTWRDKEVATQAELYGAMEGSMWRPVAATNEMELDRARAILLRKYLDTLSER